MTWLVFALMTVVSWAVYGVFLHTGQTQMTAATPTAAGIGLFSLGIAYFLTPVLRHPCAAEMLKRPPLLRL